MGLSIRRGGMRSFALPLVRPISTAHGTMTSRAGFLLTLMDEEGRIGFGEATPLPDFGTESNATTRHALEASLRGLVEGRATSIAEALEFCRRSCAQAPCALSALDAALHDLGAQRADKSLAAWIRERARIGGRPSESIPVQTLVVGDDPTNVAQSARAALAAGFETFKLKLSTSASMQGLDLGLDLERVAALRESVQATSRIRLDANEAWSISEAEHALAALECFGIDYVEQPVARDDRVALKWLDENGAVAVAADEALLGEGAAACLEARAASIFVVKPAALGGVEASVAIFGRARQLGIRVVWSSLIDGAVGRMTAVAIAAGLGDDDPERVEVHGLGTADLLSRDLVAGCEVKHGLIETNSTPGLGCPIPPIWEEGEYATEKELGEAWVVEVAN